MDITTISMGGAAWLASFIKSFPTKAEFIEYGMKGSAYIDKMPTTREGLFGQVYDMAVPPKKKK